jgi:hypothetical protein
VRECIFAGRLNKKGQGAAKCVIQHAGKTFAPSLSNADFFPGGMFAFEREKIPSEPGITGISASH